MLFSFGRNTTSRLNFKVVVNLKYNYRNQSCYDDCLYISSGDDLSQ